MRSSGTDEKDALLSSGTRQQPRVRESRDGCETQSDPRSEAPCMEDADLGLECGEDGGDGIDSHHFEPPCEPSQAAFAFVAEEEAACSMHEDAGML